MHIDIFLEIHFEAWALNVIPDKDLNPVAKSVLNEERSDEDLNPLYIKNSMQNTSSALSDVQWKIVNARDMNTNVFIKICFLVI